MPVNYQGNHELLEHARNAVISALEQYSDHEDAPDVDATDKVEALAYAFSECLLLACDTDDYGKALVTLSAGDGGGLVYVYNKTGEFIAEMSADEYGNDLVGAYNRKGEGRTLQPGP